MVSSYRTGFAVVEETAKRNAEAQQANNISHAIEALRDLYWKNEGDKYFVRFMTDEILNFPVHEAWKTVDGKHRNIACTAGYPDDSPLKRPCVICANYRNPFDATKPATPRKVSFSIVVLQEKEGKQYVDETRELELLSVPGDVNSPKVKSLQPIFALLKQGQKFWEDMNSFYAEYETTVDRTYSITKRGIKKDTKYPVVPLAEDPKYNTAELLWEKYDIPPVEGFDDPILGYIVKYVEKIGSQGWIDRWLGTGIGEKDDSYDESAGNDDEDEPSQEGLGSLQERLNKFRPKK